LSRKSPELSGIRHDVLAGHFKMTACCCQGGPFNGNGEGDEIKTGSVFIVLRKLAEEATFVNLTEGDVYSVAPRLVGGNVREALTQMIRSSSIYGFCSMVNWFCLSTLPRPTYMPRQRCILASYSSRPRHQNHTGIVWSCHVVCCLTAERLTLFLWQEFRSKLELLSTELSRR
jgi:hypothetical protein